MLDVWYYSLESASLLLDRANNNIETLKSPWTACDTSDEELGHLGVPKRNTRVVVVFHWWRNHTLKSAAVSWCATFLSVVHCL